MYKSKYFDIRELVSKKCYEKFGDKCWEFFDERALRVLDWIKETSKKTVIVNDWKWNKDVNASQYRGFREKNDIVKGGAKLSRHLSGKAFDVSIKGWTDEEFGEFFETNKDSIPFPIRIEEENTNSKIHFDVDNMSLTNKIIYFKP